MRKRAPAEVRSPAAWARVASGSSVGPAGGGDDRQAGLQVGVGDPLEVAAGRPERAEGGQAPLGVAAVLIQVLADQRLEQVAAGLAQGDLLDEDPVQGPGLVEDPGADGGDQRLARDEVQLQGQDAEEQVAVRVPPGSRPPGAVVRGRGRRPARRRPRRSRPSCPGNRPRYSRRSAARRRCGGRPARAPAARAAAPAAPARACSARASSMRGRRPATQSASKRSHASSTQPRQLTAAGARRPPDGRRSRVHLLGPELADPLRACARPSSPRSRACAAISALVWPSIFHTATRRSVSSPRPSRSRAHSSATCAASSGVGSAPRTASTSGPSRSDRASTRPPPREARRSCLARLTALRTVRTKSSCQRSSRSSSRGTARLGAAAEAVEGAQRHVLLVGGDAARQGAEPGAGQGDQAAEVGLPEGPGGVAVAGLEQADAAGDRALRWMSRP